MAKFRTCAYCKDRFQPSSHGRPPKFCSASCRQQAHKKRQRQEASRLANRTEPMLVRLFRRDHEAIREKDRLRGIVKEVLQELRVIPAPPLAKRPPPLRLVKGSNDKG
jgi:hypothetical protein